tara:strand:- start:541 stop:1761 length:1221 start_codon:yes stop_codon:yes gene_type:complete
VEQTSPKINSQSLVNILTLRYDPLIKNNLPKKDWKDFVEIPNSYDLELIENSIINNIKNQLKSSDTKKVCIALSGGVDSTMVLNLLRESKPELEINAISIKFADSVDETVAASKIAERFDANHHVVYLENYLSELPKAISMIQSPFWDLHWYYVVKKSTELSNILFSGDGGDELLSGYTFRYEKFLSLTTENSSTEEKINAYLECHERDRVPDQEDLFGNKTNFSWNLIHKILRPYFENNLSRLQQVFLADYNGKLLYNFNPINSRIVEKFKIKLITPILNPKLIELSSHLSTQNKYDEKNNIGKLPLRKILKKYNSDSLISHQKLGFNVNTTNLWNSHGHEICKYFLADSRIVKEGWIKKEWIQKYIDKPDLNVKYVNKFFGLLAFEIWYRLFITNEIHSNDTLD